ncbi:restriction endonuclease subunit S [uncultured Aquimarina sp.]|uniref:restriction endonuclease subunit S n=1 Tax=uncultured Aquimarina sp. TaxID=575652 RepID=UPI0026202B1A|nr:restriction endonuclease subunit S [uncultured Aquimarina sp.]
MSEQLKPELRFPEFDGDWGETTFDSHYSFKPTNSLSRDKLNYEAGTVKNIHYGDIHTEFDLLFDVTIEKVPFINDDVNIDNIDDENYVQKGDLVIADASEDYADIGKAIEVINTNNERLLAGLHTFLARREDDEVAEGFFAFLLNTYKARYEIMRIAQGTKVLGLSKNRLGEIPLYIPEPAEQQKIANFLKAIDKRIKLLKAKKDALEDYKTSIMQKLFSQEIRFKQDDGSDFPEWQEKTLSEVLDYRQPTPYLVNSTEYDDKYETPVLTAGKTFILGYTDETEGIFEEELPTIIFDDFTTAYKYVDFRFKAKSSAMKMLVKKDDTVNIKFVFEAMSRINFPLGEHKRYWISEFQNEKIPYPDISEQNKISRFVENIDTKIVAIVSSIENINDFKTACLQKMFV